MKKKINIKSYNSYMFALSVLFIFFSIEGSFTIQSIIPCIFLALIFFLLSNKNKFLINRPVRIYFLLCVCYTFSLILNFFRYGVNWYCIIQIIYNFLILLWLALITQKKFNKEEINMYLKSVIFIFLVCSLYILYQNLICKNTIFTITSIFSNRIGKNHFSAWIGLSSVICFYYVLYSKKHRFFFSVIFLLIFSSIFFMNSRGAILTSILCCLCVFMFYFFSNGITLKKILIILFVLIFGFIVCKSVISVMPNWLYNRYFVNSYVDHSNTDRVYRWKNAFMGILDEPIFGYGPGMFSTIDKYKITEVGIEINESTPAHNTFIDVAVNGGIVGLFIFCLFVYSILRFSFKNGKLYFPIVLHLLLNSMILGAGKTVYFWNTIILIFLISNYLDNKEGSNKNNIFN